MAEITRAPMEAREPTRKALKAKRQSGRNNHYHDDEDLPHLKEEPILDAYGNEDGAEIQYKTMAWWQGAMGMCCVMLIRRSDGTNALQS